MLNDIDLKKAKKDYPPLKYAIAVVAVIGLVSMALQYAKGNPVVAGVGFLVMLVAMGLLVIFANFVKNANRKKNKTVERISEILLWFITIAFCLAIVFLFTSVSFCSPAFLAEWVRNKPCGVVKSFEIIAPQNGESVKANEIDENGDSIKLSGIIKLPELLENKKICIAVQSNDDRMANPPIVYFQGFAQIDLDKKFWTINNSSVGSNSSLIPRGDGSCVKQYRIVAIALDDFQINQFGLPIDKPDNWSDKAIEWQKVEKLISPTKDNYDEIIIGTYVFEKGSTCKSVN